MREVAAAVTGGTGSRCRDRHGRLNGKILTEKEVAGGTEDNTRINQMNTIIN